MLLEYLAPPFAALLALLVLNEGMTVREAIAAVIIIIGVLWVITERKPASAELQVAAKPQQLSGIMAALARPCVRPLV